MARGFTRESDGGLEGDAAERTGVLTPRLPTDIGVRSQRQRILDAMAESCAEKTFTATTIADIVAHACISRGTFYKHFTNKHECFYATTDAFLVDLQGVATVAYARSGGTPADAIRDVIAAVLERLAAAPSHAKMLLVEAPIVDPEIVRRYRNLVIGALEMQLSAAGQAEHGRASPEIAFGRAKVLIVDFVAAGNIERLPSLLPELLYIALLPYAGQDAALAEARIVR